MIIILEKPACYGHIWVPKKGPGTNFLIWFLLTHFEVFISYVSAMWLNARVSLGKYHILVIQITETSGSLQNVVLFIP